MPLAAWVVAAFLGEPVDWCERPAVLRRQLGDPVEVRDQPEVTAWAADVLAGSNGVIDDEHVEDRGHADAPAGGSFEAGQRNGLDPGNASVVDPAQGDHADIGVVQLNDHLAGRFRTLDSLVNAERGRAVGCPGCHGRKRYSPG
jgi:hypothetical protein